MGARRCKRRSEPETTLSGEAIFTPGRQARHDISLEYIRRPRRIKFSA
jgi:hypothetical protein